MIAPCIRIDIFIYFKSLRKHFLLDITWVCKEQKESSNAFALPEKA
jgi:hypothetical protein